MSTNQRLALLTLAAAIGLLLGVAGAGTPQQVGAQMCQLHPGCPGADNTRTSSLTVRHQTTTYEAVEPDTGETWEVTAQYRLQTYGTGCDCEVRTVSAMVDVDWTGYVWTARCTSGCGGSSPIVAVSVCDASVGCGSGGGPVRAYELIVDLVANTTFQCLSVSQSGKLIEVDYETTSVDDGDPIINEVTCALGSSVSPTSQTFTQSDTGTFECEFTCADASGPSVGIVYE